jgi:cyclin C
MYPPSLIALACLNLACVIQKKDAKQWFSELNVDMEKVLLFISNFNMSLSIS